MGEQEREGTPSAVPQASYFHRRLYSLLKNSSFVSGYRFSDTAIRSKSDAPFRGWALKAEFFSNLFTR
ncbi:MAG: hypothetical protein ABSG07_08875 [Terriglobales bacterium]|jgi:hypothetical protein